MSALLAGCSGFRRTHGGGAPLARGAGAREEQHANSRAHCASQRLQMDIRRRWGTGWCGVWSYQPISSRHIGVRCPVSGVRCGRPCTLYQRGRGLRAAGTGAEVGGEWRRLGARGAAGARGESPQKQGRQKALLRCSDAGVHQTCIIMLNCARPQLAPRTGAPLRTTSARLMPHAPCSTW